MDQDVSALMLMIAEAKALSDGSLVIRHLFGFTGDALVAGAVAEGATRNDAEEISALLSGRDGIRH